MTTTYPTDSTLRTEAHDGRQQQPSTPAMTLGQRMVRELELFLSYALSSSSQRRWIGIVSRPCSGR